MAGYTCYMLESGWINNSIVSNDIIAINDIIVIIIDIQRDIIAINNIIDIVNIFNWCNDMW